MPEPILIIHGWSDNAKSFVNLGKFLEAQLNTTVSTIDLADWLSLNDEVTYNDLRQAMNDAWEAQNHLRNRRNVNIVTHSTGALVVREWMTWRYKQIQDCPIKRHLMLAPANYGSPLAHMGKSFLGRVYKGMKTGLQTGTHILNGLELGSSYTWNLAHRDVFATKPWYGKDKIMATVLVGNSGYGGLSRVANENGSDGTVRVSTANLNASRLTVYFDKEGTPEGEPVFYASPPARQAAFGVVEGVNHATITKPNGPDSELGSLILKALRVTPGTWDAWKNELTAHTDSLYNFEQIKDKDDYYHGYQNTVIKAYDDLDNPVEEYLVEFKSASKSRGFSLTDLGSIFHRKIIQDVHNYSKNSAFRCFYLNVTEIENRITKDLILNIDPEPKISKSQPVGYFDVAEMHLSREVRELLFQPNRTFLIDIRFKRHIVGDKTFSIDPLSSF